MESDLISIIVPIYNVERYIRQCIDSIIQQTYHNLEIILVDDGSPDNCGTICDEYAKKDSRIQVIHKENGGLSSARNEGLKIATGALISFIDSDDYVYKDFIKTLYQKMYEDNCDISLCDYTNNQEELGQEGNNFKNVVYSSEEAFIEMNHEVTHGQYVSVCNKLFKKKLFENLLFPVGKLHEDVFVSYKLFDKADRIATINKKMYYCRTRETSITRSKFSIKRLDILEGYEQEIDYFKKKNQKLYYSICLLYGHILKRYFLYLHESDVESKEQYEKELLKKGRNNLNNVLKSNGMISEKIEIILFFLFPNFYRSIIIKTLSKIRKK